MSAPRWRLPAAAGVAAVALGLGAAELAAAIVAPTASPVFVVGSLLIDLAPTWAKETAIALFGTGDKVALLVGIGLMLLLISAAAGVLQWRRAPIGRLLIVAGGIFGLGAALSRSAASVLDAVPAIVAAVVAAVALGILLRKVPEVSTAASGASDSEPTAFDVIAAGTVRPGPTRRTFLGWAGGAAAVGALAAVGGTLLQAGTRAVTAVREAFILPAATVAAPAIPAGADFGISGLATAITANDRFYRIDTALQVPQIDQNTWSLRITGDVENEIELTWAELIALPLEESVTTLTCVSNEVGGELIGTALWLGYPIREILARAKPKSGADMVLSRSIDGFTAGTPLGVLQEPDRNAIFAIGMNGEPLPPEHGFPVRMVVPGLYGYVSATKWVVELEVTRFSETAAYWTDRGWGERGPIKIESRIDVVKRTDDGMLVAGVAWHQHTGIEKVELQIDDEPWVETELAEAISIDTWVQWRYTGKAAPGDHTLRVRATGADGRTQTETVAGVLPDGATGYDTIRITL